MIIFHILYYNDRLIHSEFNIEKTKEKDWWILIETFTKNGYVIMLIDLYVKIPYELYLFIKILAIMIILKEILLYNYYSF